MDYLNGFASSISRDLVHGVIDQLRYPCCFNNFVEDLAKEEGNLAATRDSVQDRVTRAKKQTKVTAQVVDKWLKDANTVMNNADQLLQIARTEKNSCLRHCPNWIWRYRVGRKLAKKKGELKMCIREGKQYIQIERAASLGGYFSSAKCWEFDSRKPAYEELMCALEDEEVTMIGLYGMGGCGKTMLAMEVSKTASHLFDQVLFVPVSSTVDVQRIQEKIAGSLEYEFREKDEMDRSQRLCMRLRQEDRVLVIFDDVWQMLDVEAIGIPSSEHHKGCKVLITSRSEAVCTLMDCQNKIHLSTLTNDETWDLFQKQALISEGTWTTIKHLAREISNECKGLPVAIVAVASSLKGKAEVEWKVALDRLRSSKPVNIEKGLQNPYMCLQFSYDNLDSEEAKSLFLLCSAFPEDCEIPLEILTRSAIGLGLVGEVRSYEGARNEVSAAKSKLISSCLLLDVDEGKGVKMHDLVRKVAHWIAENENKVIKCVSEVDMTLDYTSLRYLWCEKFPNNLDCSNLDFLHINTYTEVSDEIFKGMGMLRVLFLYNKSLERRPLLTMTLKSLTNLRSILLSKWELNDLSFVRDIKKLESLTLHDCSFLELPDVVTQLTNLRLLDLSECDMKRNPFEVIGRHTQLEELYLADRRSKWEVEFFKKFSVPQVLQRYQIQLGTKFSGFQEECLNSHRSLFLSYLDTSNAAVKDLAEKAEVLCIASIEGGAKNIIPDTFQIEGGSMNHLIELLIRDSEEIECLVDTTSLIEVGILFSKLHWLRIEHMKHFGTLYYGRLPRGGHFENLEDIHISHCPKLTFLFTLEVAQNLAQLENLEVLSCPSLKHILIDEEISTSDHKPLFPKLKKLHVRECHVLEYIIPTTLALGLVQLECLEIVSNHQLKYVFGQRTHGDQLSDQSQNELKIDLSALEELTLVMLPNINSICPEDCYLTWPSLCQFNLQNCGEFFMVSINTCMALHNNEIIKEASHQMVQNIKQVRVNNCELEGIFQLVGLSTDGEQDPPTSCLQMLYLENLPQLRYVCKSDIESTNLQFQNLQQMEIRGCRRLKCIFSSCMVEGLPQLRALKIENCNQLDQIVEDTGTAIPSGSFGLPSLTRLIVKSCPMLGSLFTVSTANTLTSLEELMIEDCHGLKHLLTYGRAHKDRRGEIVHDDHDFQSYMTMLHGLKRLSIMRCHLLHYILPVSFACGLVKLEAIEIVETPELRYIFGQNIHASHQYPNKFQIELPVLEKVALYNMPNMISICPENYHATSSSLQQFVMKNVGLSINNLMVDFGVTHLDHSSKMDVGETSMAIEKKLVSVNIENGSKIEGIFPLRGFPINGQQVTSWLEDLKLVNLPELMYIWMGAIAKHFVSLQYLHKLHISNCPKLKAIFSFSVFRILPLLKILVVEQCEELEQIIEDDDEENGNVMNPQSPKVCFSQLKFLLVTHCKNLKHLFYISTSYEFPELEYLILNQDSSLVQVFKGVREGRVEVLLPKLKHVMLMQLPNLNNIFQEGIEIHTVTNLLVHNCPKFSQTSTTTDEDMLQISDSDKEIGFYLRPHLHDISCISTNGHEFLTSQKEIKGIQDLQSPEKRLPPVPLPNLTEYLKETEDLSIQGGGSKSEKTVTATFFGDSERRYSSSTGLLPDPFKMSVKRVIELNEETAPKSAMIAASSTHSESTSSNSSPLVEVQITKRCVYEVAAEDDSTEDNIVANALSDLEEFLKIPLKDIASSEANSIRLLTNLNFLSHLSLKDVAVSDGLKAIIASMYREFLNILCSFKQAFASTDKFAVIEAHQNEAAITLVSKISKAKNILDEAQQKEVILKERIIELKKEIKDLEAEQLSLQEEKEKCIQHTIGYIKELENVRKEKSQTVEDQRKGRQEIFEVDYQWSALCSQFLHYRIVARNPS